MIEIPASVTVAGAKGEVPFLNVFEGRRMLAAYFHMWHEGEPWKGRPSDAPTSRPRFRLRWRTCTRAT